MFFKTQNLKTKIEQNLADENQIVNLDFYNDWLNGTLYFPLWQRRKKRNHLLLVSLLEKKIIFVNMINHINLRLSNINGLKYSGNELFTIIK